MATAGLAIVETVHVGGSMVELREAEFHHEGRTRHVLRSVIAGARVLLDEGRCLHHAPLFYKVAAFEQNIPKTKDRPTQAIVSNLYGLADVPEIDAPPPSGSVLNEQPYRPPLAPWFWARRLPGRPHLTLLRWSLDSGRFLTLRDVRNGLAELEKAGVPPEAPVRLDLTWAISWAESGEQSPLLRNTEHLSGGMLCTTRSITVLHDDERNAWY